MVKRIHVWASRFALVALAVVLVAGCDNLFGSSDKKSSSSSDSRGVQNLPARFSVDAPASVRGGGMSSSSVRSSSTQDSMAYSELKSQVEWMEMEQMSVGLEFVIADRMIGTAFQLGAAESGTYEFPITRGVVDDVLDIFRDSPWWDDFGDEIEQEFRQMVGETLPVVFDYSPVSGRYDHKLETTYSDEEGEDKTVLYWDNDRRNVSLVFEWSDPMFGTGSGVYTYDDETRTATAINTYEDDGFSYYSEITLREAEDAALRAKNGVFVTYNSRGEDSFSGTFRYNTRGYADDEGGQIRITSTFGGQSFSSDFTFDATGNETSATYAFLDDFDFGDMSGAEVLGDVGFGDAGFFRVNVTGVVKDGYYLITSNGANPDFGTNVVGDATGIAADRLEVMLWQTVSAATLHAHEVDFSDGSAAAEAVGSFANP